MWSLGVVEVDPSLDGVLPGAGLTKGSGVEALLVEGAMRAFDFAVVLGFSHRYELVADAKYG
jgi:hypothetical protein